MSELVTVYIPTFNRPAMVERAVGSVLAQSYKPIEIIVVDDHSDEDAARDLEKLALRHDIILLKNRFSKGACGARNTAIAHASGEYITGLDDDDEFHADRIEQLVRAFKAGKYACVASAVTVITPAGTQIRSSDVGTVTLDALLHYNRLGNQVLTRTDWLQQSEGFDESLPAFQDYDAWVRLVALFGPALKLADPSYVIHIEHEEDRISASRERRDRGMALFMEKHVDLLTNSHRKSLALVERKNAGERLSLMSFLRLVSPRNWKLATSLLLDSHLPNLNNRARRLKAAIKGQS